jgi:Cu2+-exporting ATPase
MLNFVKRWHSKYQFNSLLIKGNMNNTISIPYKEKKVNEVIIKETFPVLEMTCAACAISVESMLKSKTGVKDAGVNFANQSAWVEYTPAKTTREDLQNTVRSIGYDLVIDSENSEQIQAVAQSNHFRDLQKRTLWASVLSLPVVIIGMFFMNIPFANWIMMTLSAPVVFYFGKSFFRNAIKQAKHGKANMDTLVALSTGVAFLFSAFNTIYPAFWHRQGLHAHVYFEAAAVIIVFISLGKLLEEKAKSNTSSALKKLMGLQPKTVTIIHEGGHQMEVPVSAIKIGDTLLVKPGEKIAVDGIVISGESYVDESMINGEPVPVLKTSNEKLFAGTINQKGSLQFRAQKVGGDTMLAQIIKTVRDAQGSKAPVQQLVDKVAGIFVPIVIGIALLTFILWMILGDNNSFTHALLSTVTVLVIACPCALGLATPTAIMVGIGKAAENSILIKDAESLESGYRVNTVVLDKTGTITEGKPSIVELKITEENRRHELLSLLCELERNSEHPLAEAVVKHLGTDSSGPVSFTAVNSITGKGITGLYRDKNYSAGNFKLMHDLGVLIPQKLRVEITALQSKANTVILFAENKILVGYVAIADKVKKTSEEAIQTLLNKGIDVYMLTGDNPETAKAVAAEAGIEKFQSEMLPVDKANFIKHLQRKGKIVAMVGDGINDSQALALADLSIAMGKGSDIAIDVANITLIGSDLNGIGKALKLSKKTVVAVRQNLFWAFIYNIIGVPLAAGILYPFNGFLLNPMIAGAAMALSSVSVVANSMRLKMTRLE